MDAKNNVCGCIGIRGKVKSILDSRSNIFKLNEISQYISEACGGEAIKSLRAQIKIVMRLIDIRYSLFAPLSAEEEKEWNITKDEAIKRCAASVKSLQLEENLSQLKRNVNEENRDFFVAIIDILDETLNDMVCEKKSPQDRLTDNQWVNK